jgi:hypothetical protein
MVIDWPKSWTAPVVWFPSEKVSPHAGTWVKPAWISHATRMKHA